MLQKLIAAGMLAALVAPGGWAQYAPAPTQYSVTVVNSMMGPPVTMQIYRNGDLVIMDHPDNHVRGLLNLKNHTQLSWDTKDPANGCSNGNFAGDWGNPFESSDVDAILKTSTTPPTSGTVNGMAAKVFEGVEPQSKTAIKVWREPKYGMVLKADMAPPGGAATTFVEIKQYSLTKPPAAMFALPPACANLPPPPPPPPTASQRFAADTGEDGANFADATMGPASPNSCTMLLRFVRAGSMQPLSNFQVALDLAYDQDHPPHYVMGPSPSGRAVFSGGHLKEYTAQIQNGVLRVPDVPASFYLEITFANNKGDSSGVFYRKCSGPQTVLLYVVKNPDNLNEGADWMWAKAGKFATVPAH